jgi:hypothetical protein
MLERPLAAAVSLVLLFCGATVSLEAMGLLFQTGVPDPQQRIEAFVARLVADLSPVDLPTEPVDLPRPVAQDLPRQDAEGATGVQPVLDASDSREVAEAPDRAEPDGRSDGRLAAAFSSPLPSPAPDTAAPPDDPMAPPPSEAEEPSPVPAPLPAVAPSPTGSEEPSPVPAPLPAVEVPSTAPAATSRAPRVTAARRATPTRGPMGYAAFGWPILDWLSL